MILLTVIDYSDHRVTKNQNKKKLKFYNILDYSESNPSYFQPPTLSSLLAIVTQNPVKELDLALETRIKGHLSTLHSPLKAARSQPIRHTKELANVMTNFTSKNQFGSYNHSQSGSKEHR